MKNILCKFIIGVVVFCLILLSVLKIADIHRDGIIIRDGIYNVCTVEAAGPNLVVWDVECGQAVIGANVHLWEASYGSPQKFYLKNIGNNIMGIFYGDDGMCVAVSEDGTKLELQVYEDKENQKWIFERQGKSQYFNIKNCEDGLYVKYARSDEETYFGLKMEKLSDDNAFKFMLRKQGV